MRADVPRAEELGLKLSSCRGTHLKSRWKPRRSDLAETPTGAAKAVSRLHQGFHVGGRQTKLARNVTPPPRPGSVGPTPSVSLAALQRGSAVRAISITPFHHNHAPFVTSLLQVSTLNLQPKLDQAQ